MEQRECCQRHSRQQKKIEIATAEKTMSRERDDDDDDGDGEVLNHETVAPSEAVTTPAAASAVDPAISLGSTTVSITPLTALGQSHIALYLDNDLRK